jgi:asparagine synthase (glutamine-hydrolysing)
MGESLNRRGPDARGDVVLPVDNRAEHGVQVGLGHSRLSVIDLSEAARQPMSNEDGTLWLTYNGEIYNFRQLRAELSAKGHRFRSDSDTEVILHLYEEHGPAAVERLNGMFAFALWDDRRRRLWLCRDRLGIKPLVYCRMGETLWFASEIKALLTDPALPRELDYEALKLYLAFNYVPAPLTMFTGLRKLEPGCSLFFENGELTGSRYWAPAGSSSKQEKVDLAWLQTSLRQTLSRAVSDCMIADVPLGAFLSGGVDSGIVVALMARQSRRPVKTFTIGFAEDGRLDETAAAKQLAAMYGTEHHEFRISQRDMLDVLPGVLGALDEPFADSSAIPTYAVSREIRKHVTVALSGDGGDELFGGYRSYLGEYWRQRYRWIPALLRKSLIEPVVERIPDSRETRLGEALRRAKKFIRATQGKFEERLLALKEVFPAAVRRKLLAADDGRLDPALAWVRRLVERGSGDGINRMLWTDVVDSLPSDMLTKVDLMSMHHSLEVRVPLLDHRVAEIAFQIPGTYKLHRGITKYVLKNTFKDLLPPGHTRRPKSGFEVPISRWLRNDLRPLVDLYLAEERIRDQGIFSFPVIGELIEAHRRRRTDTSWMLWNLVVFQHWFDRYGLRQP